jgi:hypothetical protein
MSKSSVRQTCSSSFFIFRVCQLCTVPNHPCRCLGITCQVLHAGMPLTFWVEALSTATHLINRRPSCTSGNLTPYQLLLGAPPGYDHLRVFGCLYFLNQTATTTHKLSARSSACVLLGYPSDHRGYRCFDLATRHVFTSWHVTFDEHEFPFRQALPASPSSGSMPTVHDPTTDVVVQPSTNPTPAVAPTTSFGMSSSAPASNPMPTPPVSSPSHPSSQNGIHASPVSAVPRATASVSPPQLQHHPMLTRARAGIYKPNPRYALATTASTTSSAAAISPIPSSVQAALRDAH